MKLIPRLLLGLGLAALPGFCGAINLNTWYLFDWTGHQNDLATADVGFGTPAAPWTFTGSGSFVVTDIGANQQQFNLYDNNVFLGSTSFPSGSVNCGANPDTCLITPGMSTLSFVLASGSHSLTIRTQMDLSTAGTGNIGSGTAYFRVNGEGAPPPPPDVPEPATMGLMGLGLGLGGILLRRRNR